MPVGVLPSFHPPLCLGIRFPLGITSALHCSKDPKNHLLLKNQTPGGFVAALLQRMTMHCPCPTSITEAIHLN